MPANPAFDAWLAAKKPSTEAVMRRVREVVLAADARVTEYEKYGTWTFGYVSDLAGFVQVGGKVATLMFNRGSHIPGSFARLAGDGPTARFMTFQDASDVKAAAKDLTAVVRAWCDLVEGGAKTGPVKSVKKARRKKATKPPSRK